MIRGEITNYALHALGDIHFNLTILLVIRHHINLYQTITIVVT